MERYLTSGAELNIAEKGTFQIKDEIGRGASCVVYLAEYVDDEGNHIECLLKEYNPKGIELYREETGELCLDSEEDREAFEQGLARFEEGYQKQISFRRELPGFKNATSNVQRIHSANGTKYIEMTCNEGSSYEKMQEVSLYDLLRRMKGLARIIGNYHKAGLLHLDIKPQNIFSVPETCETVLLFDFDSVVSKSDVPFANVLSYTQTWAAPEQVTYRRNFICEATDIFAIGEILFFKMFGRHSESEERRSFAKYMFDYDVELFKNVNPKVFKLLEEILHKTICRTVTERFQSTEELIKVLDEAIKLADSKEPYLKSSLPVIQNFFVGRDSEIEEIHQRLKENNVLFVSGIGGIGKSELVKNYAKKYREEYDTVIFAPFVSGIMSMVADDKEVPVYNFFSYDEEKVEDYYERKLAKIKELSDIRTLFIVDNLDTEDDKLQDVLSLGGNILITTRRDFSEYGYEQMNVAALQDKQAVFAVFENYYTKALSEEDREKVEQIFGLADGHTMTVELLAKQMMAGRVTPAKMLEKLQGGMQDAGREKVKSGKDGLLSNRSAYEHIQALFDLSDLTDEEKYVLGNLSLIPYTGVPAELFYTWCELDDYDTINELVASGWVRMEKEIDYISLHPVVAEVASELVKENMVSVDRLLNGTIEEIENGTNKELGYTKAHIVELSVNISRKMIQQGFNEEMICCFLVNLPDYFMEFGYYNSALDVWNYLLQIYECKEECGTNYIDAKLHLGRLYRELGQAKCAKKHINCVIKQCEETGENKDALVYAYDCLGDLCEIEEAEKYYNTAYKLRLELVKKNEIEEEELAQSYNNFGRMYAYKGDVAEAEKFFIQGIECLKKSRGNKTNLIGIYINMASLYDDFGLYEKAENCWKCVRYEVEKYDNVGLLLAYYVNMANHCKKKGEKEDAMNYYLQAGFLLKNSFKEGHPLGNKIYVDIANACKQCENMEHAKEFYWKALEKDSLSDIKWYVDVFQGVLDLCESNSDYANAERCIDKLLTVSERCTERSQINLYKVAGDIKKRLGNLSGAERCYSAAFDLYLLLDDIDYDMFKCFLYGYISVCVSCNEFEKIETHLQNALNITEKFCGKNHKDTALIYSVLDSVSIKLGKEKEAELYYAQLREIKKVLHKENEKEGSTDLERDLSKILDEYPANK